jgi:hypothetical protein
LEHDRRVLEDGAVLEQSEHDAGRDLLGNVGDAHVEVWQRVDFEEVTPE